MKENKARHAVIQLSRNFQMQLVGQISERAESQEQDKSESSKKSTSQKQVAQAMQVQQQDDDLDECDDSA